MSKPESAINEDNIKTIECTSWEDFKRQLPVIEAESIRLKHNPDILRQTDGVPYFRGHANASWQLQTTLERAPGSALYAVFAEYCQLLATVYNKTKDISVECPAYNYETIRPLIGQSPIYSPVELIEYFAFVRHLGFPSPLLDWSRHPYIAAFFAFSDCIESQSVAIYVLKKTRSNLASSPSEDCVDYIELIGQYLKTHERHHRQHSNYTVAMRCKTFNCPYEFIPHSQVLIDQFGFNCNKITKYILPGSEKKTVLNELTRSGITKPSVYGNNCADDTKLKNLAESIFHN